MRRVIRTVGAIRFAPTRRDMLLEILALRHQSAVLTRSRRRFRPSDRLLWLKLRRCGLSGEKRWCWSSRQPLTVGIAMGSLGGGAVAHDVLADRIEAQCRALIRQMADENQLWRAPRIHGELLKLGIAVSERTVSRYLSHRRRAPSQSWSTFLTNHLSQLPFLSSALSWTRQGLMTSSPCPACRFRTCCCSVTG